MTIMRARFRLEETRDAGRWSAAVAASGQPATAFHRYEWLRLAADMTATDFTALVVVDQGTDIGVAPWLARRVGPMTSVNRSPFPYVGPLVPPDRLVTTLRSLRARGLRHRAGSMQLSFPPGTALPDALDGSGFQVTWKGTYVVDTDRDEEALWASLESRCRTKIRKAQSNGVRIETTGHDGHTLGDVVREVFANRRLGSGYRGAFPPSVDAVMELGMDARWAVAKVDDLEVGTMVTFISGRNALLWHGGVLPAHRGTQANVLLYWDAIAWARARGARSVDLIGLPDDGIDLFKKQFGGERMPHPVLLHTSRVFTLADAAKARLRGSRSTPGAGPAAT